ncbi:MAG: ABC-type sugar transport system, periplasmic component [Devosia sp.]|uniref:ABC transporter substrate-binding protein n=1 Tax=Devosia sp. TaxID=1871048 RepID=UPI00261C8AB3|nr:sugar ABC transporter substrate-binding protein [Devosia sp.]MDB5537200.1 ABC-type sugar transport system, periplasmic component [Devosia sp.]MDB5587912.1 ABC-type sugar transport system, periplasmic component [Devosia sp.]
MLTISRRNLMLSTAAIAAGTALGLRGALAQSDEAGTLQLAAFGGDAEATAIGHAIERFNTKYPNIKVELSMDPISSGWGDYVTKVLGQFNAGAPADVYGTAIESFQALASRDIFIPLDDLAKSEEFADIAPSLMEQGSYKGKSTYIPIGWNNIMINYNRDLFDKAGVAYPKDGKWTWDEFREVAKKLTIKDASGTVTQYGYEVPNQNFFIQPWFFSNGTGVLNADWTGSNMLDPKVAESLQFLHDIIHVDGSSPIPASGPDLGNQFFAGQIAMISRGHWIVQNAKTNGMNMDVAIPPSKETNSTVIGFGGYAVSKTAAKPEIAKALVAELTSAATQIEEAIGGGGLPSRQSASTNPDIMAFPPSAALYYETLADTKAVPSPANFQEVEKIVMRYYTSMMADEVSIADGVKQAHDELEASFARLKAAG